MDVVEEKETETNEDLVKKEKERIAKLAAERRSKLMAQMSSAQKTFIKENAKAYEEATATDRTKTDTMLWKSTESVEFPIAVGHNQTPHVATDPSYTCILCQEHQTIKMDGPAMVFGAFIQKSTVLKNEFSGPAQKSFATDVYYLPTTLSPSPFTHICGHVMHSACWETHFNNISTKESRRTYRLRQPISFDVEKQEFLCPLCESLNNSVLPVLQPLTNIVATKPVVDQQLTFDSWLKSIILATEKKHEELKKKSLKIKRRTRIVRKRGNRTKYNQCRMSLAQVPVCQGYSWCHMSSKLLAVKWSAVKLLQTMVCLVCCKAAYTLANILFANGPCNALTSWESRKL